MIDAHEITAAAAALRTLPEVADVELERAERRIGAVVADNVRAAARRHRRSGRLEAGIGVKVTGKGAAARVEVSSSAPESNLLAGGTRPHTIRPIRSHALAIRPQGTIVGFAARVEHPGTRPAPFFADGVDASAKEISKIAAEANGAIAGELVDRIRRRR